MKRTRVLSLALVIVLVLAMLAGCAQPKPEANTPSGSQQQETNSDKITFTFTVTHKDGSSKDFNLEAKAGTKLSEALLAEKLIEGTEGEYGLFVTTVDGEKADDSEQGWWNLTVNGESATTGVDGITVAEGDKYGFTYTIGYDM